LADNEFVGHRFAAGPMHIGSEVIEGRAFDHAEAFLGCADGYPDSGYFEMPNWQFVDVIASERFEAKQGCKFWAAEARPRCDFAMRRHHVATVFSGN
jgi:hypothetical protein